MKRFLTLFGLGLLILFYQNCGDGFRPAQLDDDFIQSVTDDNNNSNTDTTGPTPAEKATAIFQAKCTTCHYAGSPNGRGGVAELTNIDQLANSDFIVGEFPERSILVQHLNGQRTMMPPGDNQELSALEKADIYEWINSVQRPVVIPVSYLVDVQPLLTNNCTSCHDMNDLSMTGIRLDFYNLTVQNVIPGDSVNSPLSLAIRGMGGVMGNIQMPPPPAAPLGAADIQLINDWIDQGALDN